MENKIVTTWSFTVGPQDYDWYGSFVADHNTGHVVEGMEYDARFYGKKGLKYSGDILIIKKRQFSHKTVYKFRGISKIPILVNADKAD